jgi:hypothetical protein
MGRLSKFLAFFLLLPAFGADLDRDGIDDVLEQRLLEQFAPRFHVATGDCDVLPSEFEPGRAEPVSKARNGTLYGQVSPSQDGFEIHYYHLWTVDCGSATRHPLDAESVSVKVVNGVATHWFASAHEDTLCDASNAMARRTSGGIDVWISRDRHASFLTENLCAASGCGKDRCDRSELMRVAKIVNIGEIDAWMNGALWAGSNSWTLRSKMLPNFDDALLARIGEGATVQASRTAPKGAQTTIKVAGSTYASLETANQNTANGLSTATGATTRAVTKSVHSTGRALRRAFQWR